MENFHKRKASPSDDDDWRDVKIISRFPRLRDNEGHCNLIDRRRRFNDAGILLNRIYDARIFLRMCSSSNTRGRGNFEERKTCIWPHGIFSWRAPFSGIMRVSVCGINSICVVTRAEDLERVVQAVRCLETTERYYTFKNRCKLETERILCTFKNAIIHEVEDLESQKIFKKMYVKGIEKPFSVVTGVSMDLSVIGHEASSVEFDEEKAFKFLEKEMQSEAAFTFDKTVQTAISALQHLFRKKFKANEIRVFVFENDGGNIVKEVPSRADRSVVELLAAINKPSTRYPYE